MVSIIKEFTRGVRVHTFGFTEDDLFERLRKNGVKPPYCANQIETALRCKSLTEAASVVAVDTAFWNGELTRGW